MASGESQKPTCPVCDQADQVKTMQAAYSSGVARCAPPDMPTRNVSMSKYIITCAIVVGLCVLCIVILIGGLENKFPQVYQFILAVITLIAIISALVVSFIAFQKVVRGDNESSVLLPAWDKATATWNKLYYCSRNDVVFDPEARATLSNEQLLAIRTSATHQIQKEVSNQTQSAAVQH